MTIAPNQMPDVVTPRPFIKSMIASASHFTCGTSRAAQQANDWLHDDRYPSVRHDINRGARVWLYDNGNGVPVGFGSLGTSSWEIKGVRTTVQNIPMLGVFAQFQGMPPTGSGSEKYCWQILNHLLDEAELLAGTYPWLGLSVQRDNEKAIHLYTEAGFEWVKNDTKYSRMLLWLGT